MLFVLPFLVMAIAFLSGYFSLESLQSVQVKGVINMAYINQLDKSWLSAIGFVMVLGVAYLIFFLSERFKLLGQTTTLPSLIYILLTSGIMVNVGFDYLLIAVFIVTVAVWKLQMAINDTKSNGATRYLRQGQVVSYIAMEFRSPAEQEHLVIGVCIESPDEVSAQKCADRGSEFL